MTRADEISVGASFGRAGEWALLIGAFTIAQSAGGPAMVAAYLLLTMVPCLLMAVPPRGRRVGSLLTPGAALVLAFTSPHPYLVAVLALLVGTGNLFSGRPSAWMSGLQSGPGWWGVAGAAGGIAANLAGGSKVALILAAALLILAAVFKERHDIRAPVSGRALAATAGAGFIIGARVMEPSLLPDISSAVFFTLAWAIGSQIGFNSSTDADERAVLAAPFVAAAVLAAMVAIGQGPGLLFAYIALAGAVAFTASSGPRTAGPYLPSKVAVTAAAAGAIWGSLIQKEGFELTVWVAAGVLLIGGFASLISHRLTAAPSPEFEAARPVGVAIAEAPPEHPKVPQPLTFDRPPGTKRPVLEESPFAAATKPYEISVRPSAEGERLAEPDPAEMERLAVEILRTALDTSRQIRMRALQGFNERRLQPTDVDAARSKAIEAVEELLDSSDEIHRRLDMLISQKP